MKRTKTTAWIVGILLVTAAGGIGVTYLLLGQGCLDGRGTDSYFSEDDLQKFLDIRAFSLSQVSVIAESTQSCALTSRFIVKDGVRVRVGAQEFGETLDAYDCQCGDCLLVHRTGYPFKGDLFHRASGRPLCDQPSGKQWENCGPESVSPEQDACEAQGGDWVRQSVYNDEGACLTAARDAGKACTDWEQCEGLCVGQPGHGTCTESTSPRGCQEVLRNDVVSILCID